MRFLIRSAVFMVLLQFPAMPSFAVTRDEVKSAVKSHYKVTVPGFFGNFKEIGSILVSRQDGLRQDRPRAFFRPNIIRNGKLFQAGGGDVPLGNNVDGNIGRGDRLYLYKVETGDDYVELALFTVKEFLVTASGTRGPIQLQASTRFQYEGGLAAVSASRVLDDIDAWFAIEGVPGGVNGGEVKAPVNRAPQTAGKDESKSADVPANTVKLGQTTEEVIAVMGQPDSKVLLGTKSVYLYGKMKLIFKDGKLTDAE
ncbi:MAG TPA: hypothetical protein VF799_08025 [Geobacteraceae bacterium]